MKWKAEGRMVSVSEKDGFLCADEQHASCAAKWHNDEMERMEKTVHQIAQLVTNTAGAIQNRIGELERIKHVKHY